MINELLVISCLGLVVLAVLLNYFGTAILAWGDFPPLLKLVLVVITLVFIRRLLKMATLNVNQIEDFSELGQSFVFKCNNKIYSVPPIPPYVAKKLLKNARDFSKRSEERELQIKKIQLENEDLPVNEQKSIPSDILEEGGNFYDFQIEFIVISGIMEVNENEIKVSEVTKEDIEGNEEKNIPGWSTQLVMKVFRRINEIISVEQEKKL